MKSNSLRLPVHIELPNCRLLEWGTFFVRLSTLDELDEFWSEHRQKFAFACEGKTSNKPEFLREYDWVFGSTKAAVVRTVLRWGQSGVDCEFYDWAKHDPQMHESFFLDRDAERNSMIERGIWSDMDEANFRSDCIRRSAETYRGWWRYCNSPDGGSYHACLNDDLGPEELFDPHISYQEVITTLHQQSFDSWRQSDFWELESHDGESIDELIRYWKKEREQGESYYGDENGPSNSIN